MPDLPNAFVTLLTHSKYLPGALVLLHSLHELHPEPRNFQIACLVTPETVDAHTIGALRNAGYDLVIGVEPIASGAAGQQGLQLMGRPDLDLALTKLHLFRLGEQFSTIVYLDADTLPLRPLSQLFDITAPHVLSASPDIGWPDCFNSGVMVIRPRLSDFENLRQLAATAPSGTGSFDGADQGLLNDYFSEEGKGGPWNRLPFTYNVTPSAAYQYIPAYKHYAHKINLVHFIGYNKPWDRLPNRPAGLTASGTGHEVYEYEYLIDRWFEVYDRNVRPTAAHDPNLAKRFNVPEHVAVWNQPEAAASEDDRLDLPALRAAVERGVTSFKPGQYTSLPLEGRVDLIMPKPVQPEPEVTIAQPKPEPWQQHTVTESVHESSQPSESAAQSIPSDDPPAEHKDQHSSTHHHEAHHHETHHASPPLPQAAWDASREAPPKQSRPEMEIHVPMTYTPAWDEPLETHATYFDSQASQAIEYPTLPQNVQANDWYKEFTGRTPNRRNVRPVFPWENAAARPPAARVFPKEVSPDSSESSESESESESTTPTLQASPPRRASITIPSGPPPSFPAPQAPKPGRTFAESMASFKNAWDGHKSIGKYATRLTRLGIAIEPRVSSNGLQTVPPSPRSSRPPSALARSAADSASNTSGDGDDEDDSDGSQRARSGKMGSPPRALYFDKQAQTDKPHVKDVKVQASPELSPVLKPKSQSPSFTPKYTTTSTSTTNAGSSTAAASTASSVATSNTGSSTAAATTGSSSTASNTGSSTAAYSTDSSTGALTPSAAPAATVTSAPPIVDYSISTPAQLTTRQGGRVWDPRTDIDMSKHGVLGQFRQTG